MNKNKRSGGKIIPSGDFGLRRTPDTHAMANPVCMNWDYKSSKWKLVLHRLIYHRHSQWSRLVQGAIQMLFQRLLVSLSAKGYKEGLLLVKNDIHQAGITL